MSNATQPDCGHEGCKIVWSEGKRFIRCNGENASLEAFIVQEIAKVRSDLAEVKRVVNVIANLA